jgi:prolyl-tRNA synthetase
MRINQLFSQTRREAPADIDQPGQQFLVRAGYFQPLGSGLLAALPLGKLLMDRLEERLASELRSLGAQEVDLPLVQPGSGGEDEGSSRRLPLSADSLPTALDVFRGQLRSYRQLPALFLRCGMMVDESQRRGGGLLGTRLCREIEVFSLHTDPTRQERCGADVLSSLLGLAHELDVPLAGGEDLNGALVQTGQSWLHPFLLGDEQLLQCEECGYTAAPSAARFRRPEPDTEQPMPLEKVATPHCPTIADLARFLGIPETRTAKAVFLTALYPQRQELVFAVVRGDREVNEAALARLFGTDKLRPATDEEIRAAGAAPGYASPIGVRDALVVVDSEIPRLPNLVAGANVEGFHLKNVNYGRDYQAAWVEEIAMARVGEACPECDAPMAALNGVGLARSRRLQVDHASWQGPVYSDENGVTHPALLDAYRLNLTRLVGCMAENHRDEKGLILPAVAAPFLVHLVVLPGKSGQGESVGREVESRLAAAGIEALVDDRTESPGVKFNDADLIGLPLRFTAGERALKQGGVELKRRGEVSSRIVPLEEVVQAVKMQIG